jgi:hypothetical protein
MLIGAFILVMSVATLVVSGQDWWLYMLLGAGFTASGAFWYRYIIGSEAQLRHQQQDKEILAAAQRHNGNVTHAQLVLETSLSSTQVQSALERLSQQGVTRPELLDDGTIYYHFSGLLPE